jgi:sec-independent protein translocase protein TatC
MRREYDEDLFENSKMTFGQHLEELRAALFKAILALVAGFIVGLIFGNQIVAWIQAPLKVALLNHYQEIGKADHERHVEEILAGGGTPVYSTEQVNDLLENQGMIYERVYIYAPEVWKQLRGKYPDQIPEVSVPSATESAETEQQPATTDAPSATPPLNQKDMIPLMLWKPALEDTRVQVTSLRVEDSFVTYIKAALVAGAVISSPLIFWFIWSFVAAGLYPHEKKYVFIYLPFSLTLFLAGAAVAFFFAISFVLNFLFWFNRQMGVDPTPRINDWMGFVLLLPLGFGISFQLPLVMLFLERIGATSVRLYLEKWRLAVLVICIVAMLLTPSDPQSMLLMAVPLVILYFGGILLCRVMPRQASPFGEPAD